MYSSLLIPNRFLNSKFAHLCVQNLRKNLELTVGIQAPGFSYGKHGESASLLLQAPSFSHEVLFLNFEF